MYWEFLDILAKKIKLNAIYNWPGMDQKLGDYEERGERECFTFWHSMAHLRCGFSFHSSGGHFYQVSEQKDLNVKLLALAMLLYVSGKHYLFIHTFTYFYIFPKRLDGFIWNLHWIKGKEIIHIHIILFV